MANHALLDGILELHITELWIDGRERVSPIWVDIIAISIATSLLNLQLLEFTYHSFGGITLTIPLRIPHASILVI